MAPCILYGFAKFWQFSLSILLVFISQLAQAEEIDLTGWQEMDISAYQEIIHNINPGDVIVYRTNRQFKSFKIVQRINKFDLTEGATTDVFLDDQGDILRIADTPLFGAIQELFASTQKVYENIGVKTVKVLPRTDAPDIIVVKRINFKFTIEEAIPLALSGDAGEIEAKMKRKLSSSERKEITEALYRFIRSLAPLAESMDIGMNQILYDLDEKEFLLMDFLGPPKLFDPNSSEVQETHVDYWKGDGGKGTTTEKEHEFLLGIIRSERQRRYMLAACDAALRDKSAHFMDAQLRK